MMGVNKNLMASNDTLFNFEDTLGDRDDPFSPRTPSTEPIPALPISESASTSSSIYEGRSAKDSARIASLPFNTDESVNYTSPTTDEQPTAMPVWEQSTEVAVAELLSPDQPKTFSEDTCIEMAGGGGGTSSDLSLTFDGTFTATLDDRTCILVDTSPKAADCEVVDTVEEQLTENLPKDGALSDTVIIASGSNEADSAMDCGAKDVSVYGLDENVNG